MMCAGELSMVLIGIHHIKKKNGILQSLNRSRNHALALEMMLPFSSYRGAQVLIRK